MRTHCGMTLIELLVVLAILAAVTGIALTTAGETLDQARYDETARRARSVRTAVIGDEVNPGRFLADMGRLPMAIDSATFDGNVLAELWRPAADSLRYQTRTPGRDPWPAGDSLKPMLATVRLGVGWRGPYLVVGNHTNTKFYDGFGFDWQVNDDPSGTGAWTDAPGASFGMIRGVRSLGRNHAEDSVPVADGKWADEDCRVLLDDACQSELIVTVLINHQDDGGTTVYERLIAPDNWPKMRAALFMPTSIRHRTRMSGS